MKQTNHVDRGREGFKLPKEKLLKIHDYMVKARCLEERLIRMYKTNDGYFWIGGPGEEAFNVPLAMQARVGQGLDYDYWHLHYRSSALLLVMGMNPMDAIRQMKNTATDPFSGGRNFANHYSWREKNVTPVTSTIETQYLIAPGSAIAQKRHGGKGITIVNGGDAGTAEGDFASCLIWSSMPGKEVPLLMIVANNKWGISTAYDTVHGDPCIADRATAHGIKNKVCNGLDVDESWAAIEEAMNYVRKERKPYLLEARVTRLYGHSSASGANFAQDELDPIPAFESKLEKAGYLTKKQADELRKHYTDEMLEMWKKAREEPMPDPSTIYDYTYFGQKGKYW